AGAEQARRAPGGQAAAAGVALPARGAGVCGAARRDAQAGRDRAALVDGEAADRARRGPQRSDAVSRADGRALAGRIGRAPPRAPAARRGVAGRAKRAAVRARRPRPGGRRLRARARRHGPPVRRSLSRRAARRRQPVRHRPARVGAPDRALAARRARPARAAAVRLRPRVAAVLSARMMRVLVVTKIFPNAVEPDSNPFNRQQFAALGKLCDVEVMATIPWYPGAGLFRRWSAAGRLQAVPSEERIEGLAVHHPRTLFVPRYGHAISALLYTASLAPSVLARNRRVDVVLGSWAYPDGAAAIGLARLLGVPSVVK